MFLISEETLSIILLCCTIIPIGFLIVLAFVLRLRNARISKEKSKEIIASEGKDETQKLEFENAYGGKENIVSVSVERNKVSVRVKDIEEVDGEKLKELGAQNVLLIDDEVRSSFGDRAEYIYNLLK